MRRLDSFAVGSAGAAALFVGCSIHRASDDMVIYTVHEPSEAAVCQTLWWGLTALASEFIIFQAAGSDSGLSMIAEDWRELDAAPSADDEYDRVVQVYERYRRELGRLELRRVGTDVLCGRTIRETGMVVSECVHVDLLANDWERLGLCGTRE